MDHYSHYPSFSAALVGFAQEARKAGFRAGLDASLDTSRAALEALWLDRELFEYGLAAIYCHTEEEREPFRKFYRHFWGPTGHRVAVKHSYRNKKQVVRSSRSVAVMLDAGKSEQTGAEEESKNTSGANAKETVKRTDFSQLNAEQSQLLDELSMRLLREMSLRIKRKRKRAQKGTVALADSIRKNLQNGGNIIDLVRQQRKRDKYRLLVLLDVSGSMDKYSYYLLKFLWALRHHFSAFEAFVFSTDLVRITEYLSERDMTQALRLVAHNATNWSSGTKIGACLSTFSDNFAKRYLNGNTVTIVLSDGLDTGEPEVLDAALYKIKMRSKKLIWLNPLKGMEGYQPIQRGMQAALPNLHHFGAAHNFNSLLELENLLVHA